MSPSAYQVFAQVYDQDVQLEVPRAFFRTLRPLIQAHSVGAPVLDLGCGSGLLTEQLARTGARVVGVDSSADMLALARKRCARFRGRVTLVHSGLERLRVAQPARLALACQDVVNHLPTRALVARVFARVARALSPGGALAFDTITEYCFRKYWTDNTHLLEGQLGDVVMSCEWEPERRRGTARIVSYRRSAANRYSRQDTVLHEYLHSDREIVRALRAAGFGEIWARAWSPWKFQDAEARRHRRLWCALVPEGDGRRPEPGLRALGFRRVR